MYYIYVYIHTYNCKAICILFANVGSKYLFNKPSIVLTNN